MSALIACRLVPINKNPGVRPIGVCEIARRIISKAIIKISTQQIKSAAGPLQLCAGFDGGCEAAVHAMNKIFQDKETDAILLVDATNAFNLLNRQATLNNVQTLCPTVATGMINFYRGNADLFVGGMHLSSSEGTTQGDPMALGMYAIGITPLVRKMESKGISQLWYADDAGAGGKLQNLRSWWDKLISLGPSFGYFPNESKTWLLTKPGIEEQAKIIFKNTDIKITSVGRPYLGSPIGTDNYISQFTTEKINNWIKEIEKLSKIAFVQPQAAYAAYTHGLIGQWIYQMRTTKDVSNLFQPLEQVIRLTFIPSLTGRPAPTETERQLFALATRDGGLGLAIPSDMNSHYEDSQIITGPLVNHILKQENNVGNIDELQKKEKSNVVTKKQLRSKQQAAKVFEQCTDKVKKVIEIAKDRGSSNWLTALPIKEHGFTLHKTAFRDALCLRYGWKPNHLPSKCVCGSTFTVEHALSCPTGGFPTIRHNEIRDTLATLLTDVCHDVSIEPPLQPLTGEVFPLRSTSTEDMARLDIKASGFFGSRYEKSYFDIRVCNPLAPSSQTFSLPSLYRKHEMEKKRKYERRICEVERASFIPFVMSCAGGLGPIANNVIKRLAGMLAEKKDSRYSVVMGYIRCKLSFAMLRSSLCCIRGSRSTKRNPLQAEPTIEVAVAEGEMII